MNEDGITYRYWWVAFGERVEYVLITARDADGVCRGTDTQSGREYNNIDQYALYTDLDSAKIHNQVKMAYRLPKE